MRFLTVSDMRFLTWRFIPCQKPARNRPCQKLANPGQLDQMFTHTGSVEAGLQSTWSNVHSHGFGWSMASVNLIKCSLTRVQLKHGFSQLDQMFTHTGSVEAWLQSTWSNVHSHGFGWSMTSVNLIKCSLTRVRLKHGFSQLDQLLRPQLDLIGAIQQVLKVRIVLGLLGLTQFLFCVLNIQHIHVWFRRGPWIGQRMLVCCINIITCLIRRAVDSIVHAIYIQLCQWMQFNAGLRQSDVVFYR